MNRPPFHIVETTLREGEQFANAHFSSAQRVQLAHMLDEFGVEYLELTSPAASPQSARDLEVIASLGLRAKVLTHTRCHMNDVKLAVECGAQGVNMLFATSEILRRTSHGRSIDQIIAEAREVIGWVQSQGVEVRFSCEDSFRTPMRDLIRIYSAVDELGVDRIGIADTVGIATPTQVHDVVRTLRQAVSCGIEFHGHNDCGCAVANSYSAFEGGATHLDVTVLGIGERNGITPLSALMARMLSIDPALVARYRLDMLPEIDSAVARMIGMDIPFNASITSPTAFTHKAGLHTKAVIQDPNSYEIMNPATFGLNRTISMGHRLTGWNAIAERSRELGLSLSDATLKAATQSLKARADERAMNMEEIDRMLRSLSAHPAQPCMGGACYDAQ